MRWLRHPVLHFVVGGVLLFVLRAGAVPSVEQRRPPAAIERAPIVVDGARLARMRADYVRQTGCP